MAESYTLAEVADLLGWSVETVVRRVQEGEFPGRYLTDQWEMRVPASDVRRVLRERVSPSAPEPPGLSPSGGSVDGMWLKELLELQNQRLAELTEHVLELKAGLESMQSHWDGRMSAGPAILESGEPQPAHVDVEGLLQEVSELENMLGIYDGSS